jgi:hypothetical protein
MTERPIFVVGFQRSGTTLLQSLLGAHPRIAAPPEVHFFFRIYGLRDYWGDLHDDDNAKRVVQELVNAPFGMLDGCGFDDQALTRTFLGTDRSYGALLRTLLDDFAARQGKPRWSEKTPQQRPALIWSVVPDAQVVHIVRDPREVVASAVRAWPHDTPPWAIAERLGGFTRAAREDGVAAPDDSYLLVHYEDLAMSPESVLGDVCAFLGEEFDERMTKPAAERATALGQSGPAWQAEAVAAVRPPRRQWDQRLSVPQRALVSAAVQDTVTQLGYPRVSRRWTLAAAALAPLRIPFRREQRRRDRRMAQATSAQERYDAVQEFLRTRRTQP